MFPASTKSGGGTTVVAFPDVCKTPAPPAPFIPVPYPETQYRENMKVANKVDAMAKAGNKEAQKNQKEAVDNLLRQTGIIATSATQAVMFGRAAHNRPPHRKNIVQQQSRNLNVTSNSVRSRGDMLRGSIKNFR